MSAFLLPPPLPYCPSRSLPLPLKANAPPPPSQPPRTSPPSSSPPSQRTSPPTPPSPPPPEPGLHLVAHDIRNIFNLIKSIFRPRSRPKPRSSSGTVVAGAYVHALGAASRTAERVALRVRSVSGTVAGWKILRPFAWQLPGSGESRPMWTQRVRRFVRGESVIAGVLKIGGTVMRGAVGIVGGVVKAIGAARGGAEKAGRRVEMEGKGLDGSRILRRGERMIVRPHSGDPRYASEAAKEAFERRTKELGRKGRNGGAGEKGKSGELITTGGRVQSVQSDNKAIASSMDGYLKDSLSVSRKGDEKETVLEQEGKREGRGEDNTLVTAAETNETGVNEEVARRLQGRGSDVSGGGLFGPVTSRVPDFAKRGATALLGAGAFIGTVAALPGMMTGTAVFVAGGALLNARIGGVDVETRKMVGRSETSRIRDGVAERKLSRELEERRKMAVSGVDGRRSGRDKGGVLEAKAYTVGESQPAVLDVPMVGMLLGWLDDVAYIAERFVRAVKRRVGIRTQRKIEGWELLGSFEAVPTLDGSVR